MAWCNKRINTGYASHFKTCEDNLQSAIDDLIANREREGKRMQDLILQRCHAIQEIVDQTRKNMPEIQSRYQKKIT